MDVAPQYAGRTGPCGQCGQTITIPGSGMPFAQPSPAKDLGDDAGLRMLLPVGRSGWAIAAGYCGLLSILLLPAPFALIFGIIAIRDIRRNPKTHGMGRAIFGIVMGSIFSLLLALYVVMAIAAAMGAMR